MNHPNQFPPVGSFPNHTLATVAPMYLACPVIPVHICVPSPPTSFPTASVVLHMAPSVLYNMPIVSPLHAPLGPRMVLPQIHVHPGCLAAVPSGPSEPPTLNGNATEFMPRMSAIPEDEEVKRMIPEIPCSPMSDCSFVCSPERSVTSDSTDDGEVKSIVPEDTCSIVSDRSLTAYSSKRSVASDSAGDDDDDDEAQDDPPLPLVCTQSKIYQAKCNNSGKGNVYLAPCMVNEMIQLCQEQFITDNPHEPDSRLAFGHFRESLAMQINHQQVKVYELQCAETRAFVRDIVIVNIDVHFKHSGEVMYLVAELNDPAHRDKVQWKVTRFMNAGEIHNKFGIGAQHLPQSSRKRLFAEHSIEAIRSKPMDIDFAAQEWHKIPCKYSKRDKLSKVSITAAQFQRWFARGQTVPSPPMNMIPKAVVKGKKQWFEFEMLASLIDDDGQQFSIGLSLRYFTSNRRWKVCCLDFDAGRVYYQHRLLALDASHENYISYLDLQRYFNTPAFSITA